MRGEGRARKGRGWRKGLRCVIRDMPTIAVPPGKEGGRGEEEGTDANELQICNSTGFSTLGEVRDGGEERGGVAV